MEIWKCLNRYFPKDAHQKSEEVSEVRFKKTRLLHLGNVEQPSHPQLFVQWAPEGQVKKSIYLRLWYSKSSVTNSLRKLLLLSSSKNYCQRTGRDGSIKVIQFSNKNKNQEKKFQIYPVSLCLDFPFNNFTDRSKKMHAHRINNEYNLLRNVS